MVPHALPPIRDFVNWLILHPYWGWAFLIVFTWTEFLVGLFLLTGTLTRSAAFGAAMLSFSMLFGNGWMGTACVDAFQIGTVDIAAMVFMFVAGGLGVDGWLHSYWDGHLRIGRWDLHLT